MNKLKNNETSRAIERAIRGKRDNRTSTADEIAELEASLMADLEAFDVDAAQKKAHLEYLTQPAPGLLNSQLAFPEIVPAGGVVAGNKKGAAKAPAAMSAASNAAGSSADTGLLSQLRRQAAGRLKEVDSAQAEQTAANEAIDQALRQVFSYLHELVQQLNILKPEIPRAYRLLENVDLAGLSWQEGFADFRTQAQSAGALLELVNFTCQLSAPGCTIVERDSLSVERFRTHLFDYGLQFDCKEFRNERHFVERAEFAIESKISISARWRSDFMQGRIILETRNLERFGSMPYLIRPEQIDQPLLDEFGRLLLGQPNRFHELLRR